MATVIFSYDGAKHLRATITDGDVGGLYRLMSDFPSVQAFFSTNPLIIDSISPDPMTNGTTFMAGVQKTSGAPAIGIFNVGATILQYGVPGGPFPFDAAWNYDGAKEISVEFTTVLGTSYALHLLVAVDGTTNKSGSTEPIYPTTNDAAFTDGDYSCHQYGTLWTWAPNAHPVPDPFNSGGTATEIFKNGFFWLTLNSGLTGGSEPTWTGSTVVDNTVTWTKVTTASHTWSANTHFTATGQSCFINPTVYNGNMYQYDQVLWEQKDVLLTGTGNDETIMLALDHTPTGNFSPILKNHIDSLTSYSTTTFTAGDTSEIDSEVDIIIPRTVLGSFEVQYRPMRKGRIRNV